MRSRHSSSSAKSCGLRRTMLSIALAPYFFLSAPTRPPGFALCRTFPFFVLVATVAVPLARDPVDFLELLRRKRPLDRLGVRFHLPGLGGSGDDARNDRLRREPAQGELQYAAAAPLAEGFQPPQHVPVPVRHEAVGVAPALGESRAFGHGRVALVFSG